MSARAQQRGDGEDAPDDAPEADAAPPEVAADDAGAPRDTAPPETSAESEAPAETDAPDDPAAGEEEVLASRPIDQDAGTDLDAVAPPEEDERPAAPRSADDDRLALTDQAGREAAALSPDDLAGAVYDDSVDEADTAATPDEDEFDTRPEPGMKVPGRGGPLKAFVALIVLAIAGVAVAHFALDMRIHQIDVWLGNVAEEPGSLWVESDPLNAAIFLDDADTGLRTPAALTDLSPGAELSITVQLEGYRQPAAERVVVVSGRRPTVTFPLEPIPHTLRVDSEPPGAVVLIEGEEVGTTPAQVGPLSVPAGRPVPLILRFEGYHEEFVEARWEPGQEQSSLRVSLRPDPLYEGPSDD
ncbi:MAG: PEGA domain-containing protein [Deltaproteobacteria bacterium]|nr:MAG: PEGA domain-containing protein [Deltaproteobacteria bacterium]